MVAPVKPTVLVVARLEGHHRKGEVLSRIRSHNECSAVLLTRETFMKMKQPLIRPVSNNDRRFKDAIIWNNALEVAWRNLIGEQI